MGYLKVNNIAFRGLSACVPPKVVENIDFPVYAPGEAEQVIASTGIERRHVATSDITASDLCLKAAEALIDELKWEKDSIDLLAFVTQNPDYVNLPNSFVVHEKLGLSENTVCVDYYHGCPGWVVALSSISSMMTGGSLKRALLLDGDTVSKMQYAKDREETPLFGDAGTATALEFSLEAPPMFFNIGTKSEDSKSLTRLNGGFRNPYTLDSLKSELEKRSGISSDFSSTGKMDGMDVFSFAITKAPKSLKRLCSEYEINIDSIDALYLHQANKLIVESIAKRMRIPLEKVPTSLKDYGNTTSASVPLTMVTESQLALKHNKCRNLACVFGTGLSWASVFFETNNLIIPDIIVL